MKKLLITLLCLVAVISFAGVSQWMQMVVARKNVVVGGGPTDYTQDANCYAAYFMNSQGDGTEFDRANSRDLEETASDTIALSRDVPAGYSGGSKDFVVGDTEYLSVSGGGFGNPAGANFSVVAWIKPRTLPATDMTIAAQWSGTPLWIVKADTDGGDDSALYAVLDGGTQIAESSASTLAVDTWVHIAAISTAGSMQVWINGSTSGTTDTHGTPTSSTVAFSLGARSNGSEYFDGLMDEVAVFTRALSGTEINNIMDDGIDGSNGANDFTDYTADANCVGAWAMTSLANETDLSGTGNTLTLVGTVNTNSPPGGYTGTSRSTLSTGNRLEITDASQTSLDVTTAVTVACWVNFTTGDGNFRDFCGKYDNTSDNRSYGIWATSGNIFEWNISTNGTGAASTDGTTSISQGTWYHVAGTYNAGAGQSIIYVDGVAEATNTDYNTALFDSGADFSVFEDGTGDFGVQGLMDEVIVFDRTLSASEISDIYTDGIDGTNGGND